MARVPVPSVPSRLPEIEVSGTARRGAQSAALVFAPEQETQETTVDGVRLPERAGDVVEAPEGKNRWLAGVGAGEPKDFRAAGAALVRAVGGGEKPPRVLEIGLAAEVTTEQVEGLVAGLLLGDYRFTVTADAPKPGVRTIRLVTDDSHVEAVERVRHLAAAAAFARDLANAPSNVKDPAWLADTSAAAVAGIANLTATVRDEKWLRDEGFGGVLAVGGGSASPPRLIELAYRPRGAKAHLLLVGKGITFDTGGLSIKPADGMHLMRTDMAGGAAVLAATRAIAALKLTVKVTALVPAAENHVSGTAYRPGDVVRHYGGKTTEVSNTDAEGRMVLADALVYGIRRFRPDAVVDVATLTGAMKVSLGLRTGGLFANDDELARRVADAGERAGEQWWRMPLTEDLAESVRGEIGDVRQAPGGPGGIAAALFLREFVDGATWAHLDIAGPARSEKNYADVVPGGTGFAARTLVELAASYT
ncbi:leucyl aminopeptidase family protein [Amycolatopsis sp. CA-230715]|uniref:leucyl aminopeptidase family protein n=1 Tax=Amycolatopsis sp. CA-230715 TaxID=2745196 RepID=UPI001C012170|nr:leucyl aminopeptidase [Amycolatopsis sp. CA-230715]QWF79220.1 cytosol aminopeptidase [Amycolatopsis sp. CA-230715]